MLAYSGTHILECQDFPLLPSPLPAYAAALPYLAVSKLRTITKSDNFGSTMAYSPGLGILRVWKSPHRYPLENRFSGCASTAMLWFGLYVGNALTARASSILLFLSLDSSFDPVFSLSSRMVRNNLLEIVTIKLWSHAGFISPTEHNLRSCQPTTTRIILPRSGSSSIDSPASSY